MLSTIGFLFLLGPHNIPVIIVGVDIDNSEGKLRLRS